jgi:hypothetical protein
MNGFATAQARHDNAEPPEPAEGTSRQMLGDAPVMVQFDGYADSLEIVGIVIDGHDVPAECFSGNTLTDWREAIRDELARDAAAAEQCALEF